jgi:uncharacterized protein YqeY
MAKAALHNREIEKGSPLEDDEAVRVLQGLVKQRNESITQFEKGKRPDLAERERAEIVVLRAFLPEEASDQEIEQVVTRVVAEIGASTPKDIGRVMKAALAALQNAGRSADGKKVNEAVRKRLG